jgi:hypothetical protein
MEESKGLTIQVQFDKMADSDGDSDAENDTDVANTSASKSVVRHNSANKPSPTEPAKAIQMVTGFQEFNPRVAAPAPVPQPPPPVATAPVSSWTAAPIMTTMPVGQWGSEAFTPAPPAHWSHQQEQHQPLVEPYVIGTWAPPADPQPAQQSWAGGEWASDPGC